MMLYLKKSYGFTLIEVIIFIVATAILATSLMLAGRTGIFSAASTSDQINANMLAQQCMEWLIGERLLRGYNHWACPSTPTGTLCNSPSGYTVTPSVVCTTLSGNSNFKTLTVVVTGKGEATLKTLIANY